MPVPLFTVRTITATGIRRQPYDMSADASFLVKTPTDKATAAPITLILNWKAAR